MVKKIGKVTVTIHRHAPAGGPGRDQVGTRWHQVKILRKALTASGISDLMEIAERIDRTKFRNQVLKPLLDDGLVEMTIPGKPTSSKQRYRTTDKRRAVLKQYEKRGGAE